MFRKVGVVPSIYVVVYMGDMLIYRLSKDTHPSYSSYSKLLSDGWIPGQKVVCLISPALLFMATSLTTLCFDQRIIQTSNTPGFAITSATFPFCWYFILASVDSITI